MKIIVENETEKRIVMEIQELLNSGTEVFWENIEVAAVNDDKFIPSIPDDSEEEGEITGNAIETWNEVALKLVKAQIQVE